MYARAIELLEQGTDTLERSRRPREQPLTATIRNLRGSTLAAVVAQTGRLSFPWATSLEMVYEMATSRSISI